jgi:hypothetical protein
VRERSSLAVGIAPNSTRTNQDGVTSTLNGSEPARSDV